MIVSRITLFYAGVNNTDTCLVNGRPLSAIATAIPESGRVALVPCACRRRLPHPLFPCSSAGLMFDEIVQVTTQEGAASEPYVGDAWLKQV